MVRLDAFGGVGCLSFGSNVELNDFVHIGALKSIVIGDNVMIASRVFITDHDHGVYDASKDASLPEQTPFNRVEISKPVIIGNNVWIGEGVSILAGVSIGASSVIGAGSVVTRDIPAKCLAVGNPARVIRQWNEVDRIWERV